MNQLLFDRSLNEYYRMVNREQTVIGISFRPTEKEIDEWVDSYDCEKHEKDLEDENEREEEELFMRTTTEDEIGDNMNINRVMEEETTRTSRIDGNEIGGEETEGTVAD